MPKMLHMLNLAGFGLRAWDRGSHEPDKPYSYASASLPVFDRNLKSLAEKVARELRARPRARRRLRHAGRDLAAERAPVPVRRACLALAHNGDLARFGEMKPRLVPHVKPEFARRRSAARPTASGSTRSRLAARRSATAPASADELFDALEGTLAIIREARDAARHRHLLARSTCSSPTGAQLAAVRYCFDFGCYRHRRACEVCRGTFSFLSLWYTLGRDYGLHDGEWTDDRRRRARRFHPRRLRAAHARHRVLGRGAGVQRAVRRDARTAGRTSRSGSWTDTNKDDYPVHFRFSVV